MTAVELDWLRNHLICESCGQRHFERQAASSDSNPDRFDSLGAIVLYELTAVLKARVIGDDARSLASACRELMGPDAETASLPARADVSKLHLVCLPLQLTRQLAEAFALEVYVDERHRNARLVIRVSALLPTPPGAPGDLWLEAPADWPMLTPSVAEALLRLLKRVAARRAEVRLSRRPA